MSARVVILPVIRVERPGIDPAHQVVPSADRSKVVDLWRARLDREQAQLCEVAAQYANPCGQL